MKTADLKTLDVVIPVYNEQKILEKTINTLHAFLSEAMKEYDWKIIVADNASKDNTLVIAKALSSRFPRVSFIHLDQKGRGRALRRAWSESTADIRTYMDVDLSTALEAFPSLVNALATEYDLATGTRLEKESNTKRSLLREVLSRGYNFLVKLILYTKYSDAQCGFKGITKQAAEELIPQVKDNEWFFDTELLTLSEKQGYRLFEIPVTWVEDPDSRVRIVKTVAQYLRDLIRLRLDLLRGASQRKKPVQVEVQAEIPPSHVDDKEKHKKNGKNQQLMGQELVHDIVEKVAKK